MSENLVEGDAVVKSPSHSLRWLAYLLTLIGLVDSIYLTWIKVTGEEAACAGIGDCEVVNTSQYSEIGGVPIALFGIVAYLVILILLYYELRLPKASESIRMAVFGLTVAGTIYSGYLTYLEIAVLRAICPFCVVSAVTMTGLFFLSLYRLWDVDFSD